MNFEENHSARTEVIEKENAIANHEITPKNRNENQIRLAVEVYQHLTGTTVDLNSDVNMRNDVMEYWTDPTSGESLSAIYRKLEENQEFKKHPRLKGDILKITAQDILQFRENKTLPE